MPQPIVMNISLGMALQSGAWGGGNRFGMALATYLSQHGAKVSHDLSDKNLDLILLAEPNRKLRISAYDHSDILRYLLFTNRRCLVVHRINNTSEARDDEKKSFNRFRIQANLVADHTVFVSSWVRDRYQESGFGPRPHSIIHNGADHTLWRPHPKPSPTPGKIRVVTHHWSSHWNKGFDIYQRLDRLLGDARWSQRLSFTYIGNLPEGFHFANSHALPPLNGQELARELASHDFYLTAARHEAGGNHNLEGALSGLPLLYLDSGSMAEYCHGFGIAFHEENFESKLEEMLLGLDNFKGKMGEFPFTSTRMCQHYTTLFQSLLARKAEIGTQRPWRRHPIWLVKTLLENRNLPFGKWMR